ncbi:MAG: glycosyltransferase [Rubrivivax sp.]
MARALIAWELGEAYGHLVRCLRLAQGLAARGHGVTLALKDVRLPIQQGSLAGITVLPGPRGAPAAARSRPQVNYADVLLSSGFSDAQDVAARLHAWQGILKLAEPDVLIADHAPTALLAARITGIPNLSIGNGFAIPPATSPWPSIRPREQASDQVLTAAEVQLDRVTEAAQKAWGSSRAARMRELFGAHDILDTFAELDHYGARPQGRYVGPITSSPRALQVAWQSPESPRKVLAYLRPAVPGFMVIMQALARLEAEVLCIAPGMHPELARSIATRRMRVALAPVDLSPLLTHTDLAVGYGNGGFTSQALLAGVPLAMRPRYAEQALMAQRVEALGAGRMLSGRIDAASAVTFLETLLGSQAHRRAAAAFRERHRHFTTGLALDRSLDFIESVLLDGRNPDAIRLASDPPESLSACPK